MHRLREILYFVWICQVS